MRIIAGMLAITLAFISSAYANSKPIDVEFMTEVCLVPQKDNRFMLCDNMIVHVDNQYHVAPRGFKTDLASIPRIMWPIFWPDDYDTIAAAVLHDWHYCCDKEITRLRADEIFYYSLLSNGSSKLKAWIYYIGVRRIGWLYFTRGEGLAAHAGEIQEGELQGTYEDVNYRLDAVC